jgi:tRNA threonylcarbamoyladenosine biosynthesis protein TsaE
VRRRVLETASERETEDAGAEVAAELSGGETLLLRGSLGAGKTAFVRGLARGLGAPDDAVASPTFVMLTTYPGSRMALHHADLYRFENPVDPFAFGLAELPGPREVLAIEWPERLAAAPWTRVREITLEPVLDAGPEPNADRDGGFESRRRITLT